VIPQVKLYCADCVTKLPEIETASVDAIIADLPYGITACKWDSVIPLGPLWEQYKRIIKPRGAVVLFGSQPFTSRLVMSNLEWFKYGWIWDKKLPSGFLNAKRRPLHRTEDICMFCAGPSTYNPQMVKRGKVRKKGGIIKDGGSKNYGDYGTAVSYNNEYYPTNLLVFSNANRAIKQHPTQKPVALMSYLIRTYTNEGETVLDNTMGSGSTGVACVETGRNFIGIEIMQEYFETAQERIAEALEKAKEPQQLQLAGVS